MSSSMFTATLAVPADRAEPPDYDRGHRMIDTIEDVSLFTFDEFTPENLADEIHGLLPGLDPATGVVDQDGQPIFDYAKQAGHAIIDGLKVALASRETTFVTVAGYRIYVSGGISGGNAPTDAAEAIWNADKLPAAVLVAMGFIPDHSKPPARKNGNRGHVTDTDVVDAIALGLGTKSKWSGDEEIQWVAETIGAVRLHPGHTTPAAYLHDFIERFDFDPRDSRFLAQHVREEATDHEED